jgi:hypothetical protein
MELIDEIRKRIGKENEDSMNYNGFDMSKTHDQEEENERIDKHNKEILNLFSDFGIEKTRLDCWKGTMFIRDCYLEDEYMFGGWTTEDIILFLINHKSINDIENKNNLLEDKVEISRIITKELRYEVLKRQKWRCNQCGCILKYSKDSSWSGEVAHIDHIFPFSKRKEYSNGEENINESSNLQALCPKCNEKKGKREIH